MTRPASSCAPLAVVALAVALPITASAQTRSTTGSLELWHVEFGVMAPSVGDAQFEATGVLPNAASATTVTATGRQLGIVRPVLFTVGIHPTVLFGSHIYLGPFADFGGGNRDGMPDMSTQALAPSQGIDFFRVGGEIGTVWDIGRIEARLGLEGGERWISSDMQGFTPTACRSGLCYPQANASQFFLQPRVMFGATASIFVAGVYVGADVLPDLGVSGGLFLAARIGLDGMADNRHRAPQTAAPPPAPTPEPAPAPAPQQPAVNASEPAATTSEPVPTNSPVTVVQGPMVVTHAAPGTTVVTSTVTTIVNGTLPAQDAPLEAAPVPQLQFVVPDVPPDPYEPEETEVPENPYVR